MKYFVPRASLDAGDMGVSALATTVAGDGEMTGRKMNPPAKPIAKVTIKTMIVLPCDMALHSKDHWLILLESRWKIKRQRVLRFDEPKGSSKRRIAVIVSPANRANFRALDQLLTPPTFSL
ncbi:hypothetical protein [Sphingobium sp. TKS]|uniref:hypothetical protein n=1 Tax=Sphingobium sp. TKS TaxID=1315974 RepID=UPI001F2568A6|nr:hypothetical protein [Sphingobium sp. TKS]